MTSAPQSIHPMSAKEAIDIGCEIAEQHQAGVLEMAKHFPDVSLEKLLHGNKVWLAAEIMKAMQKAEARAALTTGQPK